MVVARDQNQKQPPQVVDAALRVRPASLPAWVGVDLGAQGYAVVKVNKIVPRAGVSPETARQEQAQFSQWLAAAEAQAYYALLADKYKVQIKTAKPVVKANDESVAP